MERNVESVVIYGRRRHKEESIFGFGLFRVSGHFAEIFTLVSRRESRVAFPHRCSKRCIRTSEWRGRRHEIVHRRIREDKDIVINRVIYNRIACHENVTRLLQLRLFFWFQE